MNLGFVVGEDSVAVIDSGYGDGMAGALFVPGRGPLGALHDFEHSIYSYITTLKGQMDEAVARGCSSALS